MLVPTLVHLKLGWARAAHPAPTACIALLGWAVTGQAQTLRTSVYASGFTTPVAFVQDPTDPAVQYVVEQGGRIRVVRQEAWCLVPRTFSI